MYLLDGYNIIGRIPRLAQRSLEEGRTGLIRWIESVRSQGSPHNTVTIIFDGQPGIVSPRPSGSVQVIFAQRESADDRIKKIVEYSPRKKSIVVVTDDRDIRYHVRSLGAAILGTDEFIARLQKSTPPASKTEKTKANDSKYIPKTIEFKITTEMEKLWIKRNPGSDSLG